MSCGLAIKAASTRFVYDTSIFDRVLTNTHSVILRPGDTELGSQRRRPIILAVVEGAIVPQTGIARLSRRRFDSVLWMVITGAVHHLVNQSLSNRNVTLREQIAKIDVNSIAADECAGVNIRIGRDSVVD